MVLKLRSESKSYGAISKDTINNQHHPTNTEGGLIRMDIRQSKLSMFQSPKGIENPHMLRVPRQQGLAKIVPKSPRAIAAHSVYPQAIGCFRKIYGINDCGEGTRYSTKD